MTYFERIHNVETNEIIERLFTEEEIAEVEARKAEAEAKTQAEANAEAERLAAAEEKEAARQAVLDRLGLTAEEAALLLGGN